MNLNILNQIKNICVKKIKLPVFIIIITTCIFLICPFISVFNPTEKTDIFKVQKSDKYVNVTGKKLYYTGYKLDRAFGHTYGYYYALSNNKCVFVVVPIDGTAKSVLKNCNFKGKVSSYDRSFKKMIQSFSTDLNWDNDSLLNISSDFIISNADYHPYSYALLFWITTVVFLFALKVIIESIICIKKPYNYGVCTFIGKNEQKYIIDNAQLELNSENYIQINDMYITENYFIDFGKSSIVIIPLCEIVWCYRVGEFSLNPKDTVHDFSICFMIYTESIVKAKHKTSDEALELLNAIRATEYDIIIGHSDSKRREAHHRCKKSY